MSVYLYDTAIVNTFKEIVNDNRIFITPAENVIRTMARLNEDDVKFPMISLTRTGMQLQPRQFSMKFDGYPVLADYDNKVIQKLQAIPIKINYQVDVWTRNREENDNLVRELIFYLETHPQMYVTIPYQLDTSNDNNKHIFSFALDSTIDDNSDIIGHKNTGEYFRQTLSAYVDDAYLWKTTSSKVAEVDTEAISIKNAYLELEDETGTYAPYREKIDLKKNS